MSNFDSVKSENILYLDVGNSAAKAAFRRQGKWEAMHHKDGQDARDLIERIKEEGHIFSHVVMSSVRDEVAKAFKNELIELEFNTLTTADIPREMLDYETPETLGVDRFLACYGAVGSTPKAAVVIDAGTACTIDFMGADEVFRGGVIAPGFSAFTKLLSTHAPALPFLEFDTTIPEQWPGKSTIDSLSWGQAGFFRDALRASLDRYEEEYDAFDLFLTGGDAAKIEKLLDVEGRIRPFLVFEGMERMAKELLNIDS